MKKPIALMLISIMVLMLSAFSFAGNGNLKKNMESEPTISAYVLDNQLFITVWLDAEIGDELDGLRAEIFEEDEEVPEVSTDEFEMTSEFGSKVYKYTFEEIDYTPADEFEIRVIAEFDDAEDELIISKSVELEDIEVDDENMMDNDMYPAAPAVANELLKEAGIPNRVMNVEGEAVNLIALVAAEMHEEEPFDLEEAYDLEELKDAVEGFLVIELNKLLGKTHDNLSDFTAHFAEMEKTVAEPKADKIKPQHDNDDDEDDEDEMNDDEDDDDEDDDEDDEDKDNSDKEKPNKK